MTKLLDILYLNILILPNPHKIKQNNHNHIIYQIIPKYIFLIPSLKKLQFYLRKMKDKDEFQQTQQLIKGYKFYLGSRQRYIIISSNFDSGNIQLIRQISQFQYRLASTHDGTYTEHKVNSKSWFYFSVEGFPKNTKGKFFITKVQTLASLYYSKYNKTYRPVYKSSESETWERLPTQTQLVMREDGELECIFQYLFKDENQKVYFAFSYPFSYTEHITYLDTLNNFLFIEDFYFHKQILTKSLQGRDLHLLTITSHDHLDPNKQNQQLFNQVLFPQKNRGLKFVKPVILISARVHPGQSASSYAMKGVIDFLTSKKDLRAKLLRKMFVFMIIPMINVDGVYHGNFRMDCQGKNLNRYYINPTHQKQPVIYAIKELAVHLNKQNRLSFYFDLHAHNAKKGHFIYGNAIHNFVQQVQSQVFCKIVQMNNKGFQYEYCNFSQKHMNAKDHNQDLTKQGCGRVVMHKLTKIIHSYSVQCGIISPNKINQLPLPQNLQFQLNGTGIQLDECEDNNHQMYKSRNQLNGYFTIPMYENIGKNLMVSILDVFDKNPYNRVYNSKYKSMDMLRRMTAYEIFHETERFRMFERFVFGKVKHINQLIKQVLNTKLHYRKLYNFYFFDDKQLKTIKWPFNIPGLSNKSKLDLNSQIKKIKSIDLHKNHYSQSFIRALMGVEEKSSNISQEDVDGEKGGKIEDQSESENQQFFCSKNNVTCQYYEASTQTCQQQKHPSPKIQHQKKHISLHQISILKQVSSTQLLLKSHQQFTMSRKKQNTSVRVRKLLKQDFISGTFKQQRNRYHLDVNQKKSKKYSNVSITGTKIKRYVYPSIEKDIREQQNGKQQIFQKNITNQIENQNKYSIIKLSQPLKTKKQKIKSFVLRKAEDYTSRNKIQLPTLCNQVYVISTSAKMVVKKY